MRQIAVARIRQSDGEAQSLEDHLLETGLLAEMFAEKAGLPRCGQLLGLVHDLGKYSDEFQDYILLGTQNGEGREAALAKQKQQRGKIDHSTAGAQWIWQKKQGLIGQILALAACSHHTALIDCLAPNGKRQFHERMARDDGKTHFAECLGKLDPVAAGLLQAIPLDSLYRELLQKFQSIEKRESSDQGKTPDDNARNQICNRICFTNGLLCRFLLSCLLDADRISSAGFEDELYGDMRSALIRPRWKSLSAKLEGWLAEKSLLTGSVQEQRRQVSDACLVRSEDTRGFFTLSVPTGGGKTLASLRFALRHAEKHSLDRVFYVIPHTSIIDQNAQAARDILEQNEEPGTVVLEHHSNIVPEEEHYRHIRLAPNWESPVVFTTMVQFLETLFGSGTRNARRMHTLARSVIIFDEIQTLPLKCAHMFCNALNFLVHDCGSSVLLCTATQPLLGRLPDPLKGQIALTPESEIIPDPDGLFKSLRRVEFVNHCGQGNDYLDSDGIACLALDELESSGSCLIVCNTKKWAEDLYRSFSKTTDAKVFYLSTHLCPAHRREVLAAMRQALQERDAGTGPPVLCCSTQVIECGVDVDFGSVIRFAAGLDSILQAAGRCNRNGKRVLGRVHIVQPRDESLASLPEIKAGKDVFFRLMREEAASEQAGMDLTRPELIERYFNYYFFEREQQMVYPVDYEERKDWLLRMLGSNSLNPGQKDREIMLQQSFATAARLFRPIEAETQGVLVPYEERGKEIIAGLLSSSEQYQARRLLREAQQYSVNLYPGVLRRLRDAGAVRETLCPGVYCLEEGYYHKECGVTLEWLPNYDPNLF